MDCATIPGRSAGRRAGRASDEGGELASIKIGRRRLFPETAVAAFIQRKLEEAARG
jgi:hypothetical protein